MLPNAVDMIKNDILEIVDIEFGQRYGSRTWIRNVVEGDPLEFLETPNKNLLLHYN